MGPRDYEDDYGDYDEVDSDMTPNEQMWADRYDYADELYERGRIDGIQRSEIRAGA